MISITVHQLNQRAEARLNQSKQTPSVPKTSVKTPGPPEVEIQYFKRYFKPNQAHSLPSARNERPIPKPRHLKQSVASELSSSSSSLSSSDEFEMASNSQVCSVETQTQLAGAGVEKENVLKPSNRRLHSRSISLVINPDFSNNPSDKEESTLRRRKSLPRRTKLRLTKDFQLKDESLNLMKREIETLNQSKGDEDKIEFVCTLDNEDSSLDDDVFAETTNDAPSFVSDPEVLERFRQAGAILRQISEEFVKTRRRTI